MKLREYQENAIKHIRKSLLSGKRTPVLMSPTGSGKTIIAIEIIKRAIAKGKTVMFVVDMIQLINQTSESFDKHGLDHNVIQGDHPRYNPTASLHLASVQTLKNRNVPYIDLVIIDECHVMFKSLIELMKRWTAIPFIGVSATPWSKGMGLVYDDLVVVEKTKELIKQGYLCKYEAWGPDSIDLSGLKTVNGDYEKKELGKRATKIVGDVVSTWLRRGENEKTVCFSVNVAHSKAIVDEFLANGVSAVHIDSYVPEEIRKQIFTDYEAGKYKILSNVGITTKGWDSPNTKVLIYARPTKSLKLHIQILGRILRTAPNKDKAIILDHGKNIERLGFPDDDLPTVMCNGDVDQVTKKREEKEREEKAPKPCKTCFTLHNQFKCPNCGEEPKKLANVEAEKGQLKKLSKTSMNEKQDFYAMLLYWVRARGKQDGYASHLYKEKFGVWPSKKTGIHPKEPTPEMQGMITNLLIQKGKQTVKNHSVPHDKPVPGYVYTKQITSNGMVQVKATLNGKYKFFAEQTPEILKVAQ